MKDILVDGKPLHVPLATLWYCAWILLGDSYSPQVATFLASVIEDTEIVELYELDLAVMSLDSAFQKAKRKDGKKWVI